MKNKQIVYLDCDEVLLKTAETHAVFLHDVYNFLVDSDSYPSKWDFNGFHNLNFNESTKLFIESEYFTNVPPVEQAKEAVDLLKKRGFFLSVITSISDLTHAKKARTQNLKQVFGRNVFDEINFLPLGWNNKFEFFQKNRIGTAIDDSIFNVQAAIKCGHQGILMAIKQNLEWHSFATDNGLMMANGLFDAVKQIKR